MAAPLDPSNSSQPTSPNPNSVGSFAVSSPLQSVASVTASVAQPVVQQSVNAVSATIDPNKVVPAESLTIKAQQVASKCEGFVIGVLGRSGVFHKRKIPADKEAALKEKYIKIREMLEEKGLVPSDAKGFNLNPELLQARYKDKDGQVKVVSLLDLYTVVETGATGDDSFRKMLDDFDMLLRGALDIYDPSSLSSLRPASIPLPSLRRSWDDVKLIGIKQRINDLNRARPLSAEQTQELSSLEKKEKGFTLADPNRFPTDSDKVCEKLQGLGIDTNAVSRHNRAKKIYAALNEKLELLIKSKEDAIAAKKQLAPSADCTDLQLQAVKLKQLKSRLNEVDLFALYSALAMCPDKDSFTAENIKKKACALRDGIEKYYDQQRADHMGETKAAVKKFTSFWKKTEEADKPITAIADKNYTFAKDVGGLIFSAHKAVVDTDALGDEYYSLSKIPRRDRSCIDELFDASMKVEFGVDSIAEELLSSPSFNIVDESDKGQLKEVVNQALTPDS